MKMGKPPKAARGKAKAAPITKLPAMAANPMPGGPKSQMPKAAAIQPIATDRGPFRMK